MSAVQPHPGRLDRIYATLVDEEDARVCREISAEACRVVPGNFFLQMLAQILTKLGDACINPKTVLAWVLVYVQAPAALVAFLVPVRESGSLLPQLVIASYVRRLARRKWIWVAGALLQGVAVLGIAAAAATLRGVAAGVVVLLCLIAFSLARGLASVAAKDVLGKTVPKSRRGRLAGFTEAIAGVLVLGLGSLLLARRGGSASPAFFGALLAAAAGLWLLAAAVYAMIREEAGATEGGGNALAEALRRLALLRDDPPFRRFVIVRSLLLASALTAPYFVVVAQEQLGAQLGVLGTFVVAGGLASSLSAPFWGRFADRSSRSVMTAGGLLTAGIGLGFAGAVQFVPALRELTWFYPTAFFMLSIAHSGVRLGRKTYVVDLAGGNRRTDYVAVSNSVIGAVLLVMGLAGAVASAWSALAVLLVLSTFGLAGALLAGLLPEVE
jgi:hypothetical protein